MAVAACQKSYYLVSARQVEAIVLHTIVKLVLFKNDKLEFICMTK